MPYGDNRNDSRDYDRHSSRPRRQHISTGKFVLIILALTALVYTIVYQQNTSRYVNVIPCMNIEGGTLTVTTRGTFGVDAPNVEPDKVLTPGQPYTFEVRGGGIGEYLPFGDLGPRVIKIVGYVGGKKLSDDERAKRLETC